MSPETSTPAPAGPGPDSGNGGWTSPSTSPGSARGGTGATPSRSPLDGLKNLARNKPHGGGGGGSGRARGRRGGSGGIDLRNTWQILVGSILIPLGIVFLLMSWYGAAHTPYVQQQIPYLVSGSFAALGCFVVGGLLYWAHWLYRLYDQADAHHEEQLKFLEQALTIMSQGGRYQADGDARPTGPVPAQSALAGSSAATSVKAPAAPPSFGSPAGLATAPPPPGATASASYVVTPSGSVFHLPSCPVVAHHSEGLRVLGPAAVVDMEPCRICLPEH
ncbi:MAG: hypothetical protein ACYDA2_00860 [Acidimicrobiales bacterium]